MQSKSFAHVAVECFAGCHDPPSFHILRDASFHVLISNTEEPLDRPRFKVTLSRPSNFHIKFVSNVQNFLAALFPELLRPLIWYPNRPTKSLFSGMPECHQHMRIAAVGNCPRKPPTTRRRSCFTLRVLANANIRIRHLPTLSYFLAKAVVSKC